MSSIYETEPQGLKEQQWFCNQVAHYQVDPEIWAPEGFLSTLTAVEDQMHRARGELNGPRIIDLDLLLFGNIEQCTGYLDLPHPRLEQRAFVLIPLLELSPDLILPSGLSAQDALSHLDYRQEGNKIWQD